MCSEPGQPEGHVCAMCTGRLGPVSDKDTASECLVCIPFLPVGLSFKAKPLLFGMGFQWGKVSLGPSSSCLDLLQRLSSLWFGRVVLSSAIFFSPLTSSQQILLTLTPKYAQNLPIHAAAIIIAPGLHLSFLPVTLLPLLPYTLHFP